MDFIKDLKVRLSRPLPGPSAQQEMSARRNNQPLPPIQHFGPPKRGGVALVLYPHQGTWYFPLMKRPSDQGIHSDQVSLPGGKQEQADIDLVDTALRETREELGIAVDRARVVGTLSELYIFASHFQVLPVVAVLDETPMFQADPMEVTQVITSSIGHLLKNSTVKQRTIEVRGWQLTAPYFDIEEQVVWGATAMILNEFRSLLTDLPSIER